MTRVEKLLSISSESLSRQAVTINLPNFNDYGQLCEQLMALLSHNTAIPQDLEKSWNVSCSPATRQG
jgi:hypothetical protein